MPKSTGAIGVKLRIGRVRSYGGKISGDGKLLQLTKTERTATKVYRTREQARADVFDYIERLYDPTRRHSTLGYVSPIQFEKAQEA